jgi:predicted MFS family arabinose efflux permease
VQGAGGGVLSAVAYVLVRTTFPEGLWPRVFALLAGIWSVSVLVGPLVGGGFARYASWRGAFFAVAALAGLLALVALRALPMPRMARRGALPRVPAGRVALICLAIAAMSLAAIAGTRLVQASLIAFAVAALTAMLRLDRAAKRPVMPSDAFSLHSATGVGLWIAVLLSIAFVPLQIFVPVFLQRLHGFDPLAAGYALAGASMAWTVAAIAVAGLSNRWASRMMIAGPIAMVVGLLGVALAMPSGSIAIFPTILLVGGGIGACWAFTVQAIMRGARRGEEDTAASSVATVQQTGLALGAAVAGLVANAVGFSVTGNEAGIARAAFWVPLTFMTAAALAAIMGVRLGVLSRRIAPDAPPA